MSTLLVLNYPAILVAGIAIFMLGGLWYSPVLFARKWVELMGKTEDELKANAAGPGSYIAVFFCGLVTAFVLAWVLNHLSPLTLTKGLGTAVLCWLGFAGATSFGSDLFSGTPKMLWLINSAYNLVAFVVAALILTLWQ